MGRGPAALRYMALHPRVTPPTGDSKYAILWHGVPPGGNMQYIKLAAAV
jgi:hypothetical protein